MLAMDCSKSVGAVCTAKPCMMGSLQFGCTE
jgi:hypothetical protein